MIEKEVIVVGAGLAGCEAAWQIANSGVSVKLVEIWVYFLKELQLMNSIKEMWVAWDSNSGPDG